MESSRVKPPSIWVRLNESSRHGFRLALNQSGMDGFEYQNPFRLNLWRDNVRSENVQQHHEEDSVYVNHVEAGWRLNNEKHSEKPRASKKRWQSSNPIPSILTAPIWIEPSNTVITPQANRIGMSQIKNVSGTGTTSVLIAPTLAMLNGLDASGEMASVALHNCAAIGDVTAGNKVWESKAEFMTGSTFTFEGVLFLKGMVAVFTCGDAAHAFNANIEWE